MRNSFSSHFAEAGTTNTSLSGSTLTNLTANQRNFWGF
jgi:hypothetical protein